MPVWLDQALAYSLLMGIGIVMNYAAKRFDAWYRPRYEREFQDNPRQRMAWDVLWTLTTRRSPIVLAFWGPLFGWLLIVLGGVALADLLIRNW